jgi:hypothetical protein
MELTEGEMWRELTTGRLCVRNDGINCVVRRLQREGVESVEGCGINKGEGFDRFDPLGFDSFAVISLRL